MLDAYEAAHFFLDGLRNSCSLDIPMDMHMAQSKNPVQMLILTQTGECSVRLV
jgi:hypothetical protein